MGGPSRHAAANSVAATGPVHASLNQFLPFHAPLARVGRVSCVPVPRSIPGSASSAVPRGSSSLLSVGMSSIPSASSCRIASSAAVSARWGPSCSILAASRSAVRASSISCAASRVARRISWALCCCSSSSVPSSSSDVPAIASLRTISIPLCSSPYRMTPVKQSQLTAKRSHPAFLSGRRLSAALAPARTSVIHFVSTSVMSYSSYRMLPSSCGHKVHGTFARYSWMRTLPSTCAASKSACAPRRRSWSAAASAAALRSCVARCSACRMVTTACCRAASFACRRAALRTAAAAA